MRYSRYTHEYVINDCTVALYQALMVKVVFLCIDEIKMIKEYLSGINPTDESDKKTINYLYENYFIVNNNSDDDLLLKKCVELIPPSAISNAYIIVTENCNFNCKYCFISDAVQKKKHSKIMTTEVADKAVALLQSTYERQKEEYDKTITFYGGEPLLNIELIQHIMNEIDRVRSSGRYWPSDVKYAVITNGSLITNNILDILQQHNIALSISYDVDKKAHSYRVSKSNDNSYLTVRGKIELCKKRNHPFSLSITISEETIKNRKQILEEIKQINPVSIAFNMLIPNKYGTPPSSYYEDATDFMIESFMELRELGVFEDRVMRKVHSFNSGKLFMYDCCASGGNQLVINPLGEVGVCHGYLNNNKFFSGRVSDNAFDYRDNRDFQYWKSRTPLLMKQCYDCECIGICGGGCPYAADYMHGSIYEIDDRFCIHAKKLLRWMINDLFCQIKHG